MTLPNVLPNDLYLKELDRRVVIVRTCFKKACGEISKSSGVHRMLEAAESALTLRTGNPDAKLHPDAGKACCIVWRLANSLQILLERRIRFDQHLKVMRNGDALFGQKDAPGKEGFKDFELELYVAAQLCDRNSRKVELHPPGHPFDITFAEALRIECKHPLSESKMAGAITDLGKALDVEGANGALVFAVEDVLELAKMPIVGSSEEIASLVQLRCEAVLSPRTKGWRLNFDNYPSILGIYFTTAAPVFVEEGGRTDAILYPLNVSGPTRGSGDPKVDSLFREFLVAMR